VRPDLSIEFKGMASRSYSLCVGADGPGSAVRQHAAGLRVVNEGIALTYPGWGYWSGLMPKGSAAMIGGKVGEYIEIWGEARRLCLVPLPTGEVLYHGWVHRAKPSKVPRMPNELAHALKAEFAALPLPGLLEALAHVCDRAGSVASPIRFDYTIQGQASTFSSRRVALVGDAAHAIVSTLHQNSAIAIGDSFELARQLSEIRTADHLECGPDRRLSDGDALQKALGSFQQRRIPRVNTLMELSKSVGGLVRMPAALRDPLVRSASWFPGRCEYVTHTHPRAPHTRTHTCARACTPARPHIAVIAG
jgi:2-polyprenyl-6-methoxyphenol hydroxylase-like FAD-dependent oxidoreductase